MAIKSVTLGTGATQILAPTAGQKFGVTSMWICNNHATDTITYTLFFGTTAGTNNVNVIYKAQPLAAGETRELSFERIALDGADTNVLYGLASVADKISVNVSYINLV